MPPKRKTAAAAASKKARLVKSDNKPTETGTSEIDSTPVEDNTSAEEPTSPAAEPVETTTPSTKRKHKDDSSPKSGLADRLAKLKELKKRRVSLVIEISRHVITLVLL